MAEIGIINTTTPIQLPTFGVKTQNLDALFVGGGKNIMDLGRKGFVNRVSAPSASATFGSGSAIMNEIRITSFRSGNQGNDVSAGTEVDKLSGKNIIAIVERVVYVGSKIAANVLPGGANITESDWDVISNPFSLINDDTGAGTGALVGLNQIVSHMYIRNIGAGSVTVTIDAKIRYILNSGT